MKPDDSLNDNLSANHLQEFQQEIDLLQQVDFSKPNNARYRVQMRLQERMLAQPWWQRVWSNVPSVQVRLAVALSALLLFGGLNARGLFSLPQHATFVAPIPFAPAMLISEFRNERLVSANLDKPALGTINPSLSLARTTPQVQTPFTISLPTPIPVPAPATDEVDAVR